MHESMGCRGVVSTPKMGTDVRLAGSDCKFGTIVRALWPIKPALNLAQRIGCTERAAQFYIDGARRPSVKAILAVVNEVVG